MRGLMVMMLVCVCGSIGWAGGPTITKLEPDTLIAQSRHAGTQRDPDDVVRILYNSLTRVQIAATGNGDFIKFDFKGNPEITATAYKAFFATDEYTPLERDGGDDFAVTDVGSIRFGWQDVGEIQAYIVDTPKYFGLYDESRFVADFKVSHLEATGAVGDNSQVQLCARKGSLPDLIWAISVLSGKPIPVRVVVEEKVVPEVVVDEVVEEQVEVPVVSETAGDIKAQLLSLKELFDEGLITEGVYEDRQQRILDQMP